MIITRPVTGGRSVRTRKTYKTTKTLPGYSFKFKACDREVYSFWSA